MTFRFNRSLLLLVLAAFACLNSLAAQVITHDTPAASAEMSAWLHSNDARLIAWAATLARERRQTEVIAQLPGWLKDSTLIRNYGYAPARPEDRAYQAVLDALIRGGSETRVEPNVLSQLGSTYPIQTFILLDRLPPEEQVPVLKDWVRYASLSRQSSQLARLAAMRLAQWPKPVPEFAARILTDSREQLTIDLWAKSGPDALLEMGNACGDSMGLPVSPGWPVVYFPIAEQGSSYQEDVTLVALDGITASYRWVSENVGFGSCFGFGGLDQNIRWRILAHWLKATPDNMETQSTKSISIQWTNRAQFQRQLGRVVAQEQSALNSIAQQLLRDGFLSKAEITWARPELNVRVVCHIKPCPIPGAATDIPPDPRFSY